MDQDLRLPTEPSAGVGEHSAQLHRAGASLLTLFFLLTQVPTVSAHGATATAGLARGHGLLLAIVGITIIVLAVAAKRTARVRPTAALAGVFVGIVVAALGAILFEGLSPDPTFSASTMPFPRSWYPSLSLSIGLAVIVASFLLVWWRWPSRPRYAVLGYILGLWIGYPYLVPSSTSHVNPLGYLLVVGTPIVTGYVVWKDVGDVLRAILRDRVATAFGAGVGIAMAFFFIAVTGYLSFFPEEGMGHEVVVVVLPTIYQLVMWPTLEIVIPHIPFFLALSPGLVIIVGLLSTLIGLNTAVIARHWRVEEQAGLAQGTAGSAAIIGTCTCGCCGPLIAKVAIVAAGPAIAAPLYWVFVDGASPLSAMFIVGSLALFSGSLIHSIQSAGGAGRSASVVPVD
jgi:hypothetical protein